MLMKAVENDIKQRFNQQLKLQKNDDLNLEIDLC